jgi:transcription initiation factor IIE alpha subunit
VVSKKLAMTPTITTSNATKPEKIACPKCDASLHFYRSDKPYIDECGFESYSFRCRECGSMLVGIIDPADGTLLLTVSSSVQC